jgi:hypothetical protein
MTNPWEKYAADFRATTDDKIEVECERCRDEVATAEEWLEAVASWEAAGKPR